MNTTEQSRTERIHKLASEPGPCLTMAISGRGERETRREWKNALTQAREKLQKRGVDVKSFLEPVIAAEADVTSETNGRRGIVILRSGSLMEIYRIPSVTPTVRVDDRFDLRTILSVVSSTEKVFYILALSQKRTRILRCTDNGSEELPFPARFPNSLADAMQTRKPDHNLDNRASGGPSMGTGGVVFGTSSDHDDKDEYILHFFMELDKAVNAALRGSADPLIPAGVEREIALYRRINTYAHLVEPGIHGAPDGLEGGEMHRRALHLLEEWAQQPGREVPADLDKRIGTGHASIHIQEIVSAAYQGRVSHIFFHPNSQYLGTYDPVRQRVKHTDDPLDTPVDLIEAAAYQTILQGGEARILPARAMPNGVPVCALFRYPVVENSPATDPVQTAP